MNYCTIRVTWSPSAGAAQYVVYRRKAGTKESFRKTAQVNGTTLTYLDKKATLGVKYEYAVEAIGKVAGSGLSKAAVCQAVPGAVKVKAKAFRGSVKLTWKKVKTAKKKYAGSYRVYRKTAGGRWKKLVVTAGTKNTYTDQKVKKGTRYYYRVVATAKKERRRLRASLRPKASR